MEQQTQIIKDLLETLLEKMTVCAEVSVLNAEEYPQFIVRTQEAGILIGENGQHLIALNHVLKKLVDEEFKKQNLEKIQFLLDINDYQIKKIEEIRNLSRVNAQRVRFFKKEIELEPMSAYDRRIVHDTLTEYPDIVTESIGVDPDRRVVIKPSNL